MDKGEIYWTDVDFDKGIYSLKLKEKKERLKRISLLKNIFFRQLDEMNEQIYISPYFDVSDEYYYWFHEWKNINKNFHYREIINEANNKNIYLKQKKIIDYNSYKDLAIKFFKGNVNYISKSCYIVPKLNMAFMPTHSVDLLIYGDKGSQQYMNIVKNILRYDIRLNYF